MNDDLAKVAYVWEPEQRKRFLELVRDDAEMGDIRAAREVGVPGKRAQVRAAIEADPDLKADLRQARREGLGKQGLGIKSLYKVLSEIVSDPEHKDRLKAAMYALNLNGVVERQRVEMTGEDGGPVEVNNPDVAAAVDRFTALADAAIRAASRRGTQPPTLEP